jgi:hypothetical protein
MTWLSPHIRHFTTLVAPLRLALTKAHTTVHLNDEALTAFQRLKDAVTSAEALGAFDPTLPLDVVMDACETGGGSVLFQAGKPLAFHSYCFRGGEINYEIRQKELSSLLKVLKRYRRWFVEARGIRVFTDHEALRWFVPKSTRRRNDSCVQPSSSARLTGSNSGTDLAVTWPESTASPGRAAPPT